MTLTPGTRLGPYEIVAPLGAGGMGEVYRARDPRLGREVAIKVLPRHLAASPEVRARFEREARTVSQLNHPNICTIHDVGRAPGEAGADGTDFLVMELIDGETLAHRLTRGPLPLAEAIALSKQIGEALERAHRAGVVHRDLKPGNIMLTRTGAKLMDFGLARPAGFVTNTSSASLLTTMVQSPTATPLTTEGAIIGTFQYMPPEQLEGKEADARSDVWALGCVIYEAVTGTRAFAGASQASLIASIMTGEPRPVAELQPVSPPGLDRVIRQCMRKDPDARWQSARDVALALELVSAGDLSGPRAAAATQQRRIPAWIPVVIAAAIIAAGFIGGRLTAPPTGEGSIRISTLSQGTRDTQPAVSPDGRLIAFSAVRQHGQGIWLMDMVTRSEVKLTSDADQNPRFTADGGSIVFTRLRDSQTSLWRIPVIGGAARLMLEDASDADPSPDGSRVAYIFASNDSTGLRARLMVARSDGTAGRELWSAGSSVIGSPRWSTDGTRIALVVSGGQNTPNSIAVVEAASGKTRLYPSPTGSVLSNPAWDGTGNGLILAEGIGVTAVQRGTSGRLYRLDLGPGKYRALGWLENFPSVLDVLPDGRLVLSSLLVRQNLREVALDARDLIGGRWLTTGMAIDRQPVYSPDGKSVMYSSNRGGTLDIWEVQVENGEMHRVTDDPADDWDPEYAPDGNEMYWCSGRSGAFEIWTARRDGSAPRQISHDSLDAENPQISPDNRWVYYSSGNPAKTGLWRSPVSGEAGELLMNGSTLIPDLSPDGRHLSVIIGVGTIESKLAVFDLENPKELPMPVPLQVQPGTVQNGRSRMAPDGNAVVYLNTRADGRPVLLRRSLSAWRTGGGADTLFAHAGEAIESFGLSPDGKRAVVSVVDWLSGLTIAEGVQGIVPPKRR